MSKCCCDPFKIHKKTSNCVVMCYHKCVTPMFHSKTGRNYVFGAERKSYKCQGKCQLNKASPVPQKKKN